MKQLGEEAALVLRLITQAQQIGALKGIQSPHASLADTVLKLAESFRLLLANPGEIEGLRKDVLRELVDQFDRVQGTIATALESPKAKTKWSFGWPTIKRTDSRGSEGSSAGTLKQQILQTSAQLSIEPSPIPLTKTVSEIRAELLNAMETPSTAEPAAAALPSARIEGNIPDYLKDADVELVPCPHCGRSFFPARLEKHISAAHADIPPAPRAPSMNKSKSLMAPRQRQRRISDPDVLRQAREGAGPYLPCPDCGREFLESQLATHSLVCAGPGGFEPSPGLLDDLNTQYEQTQHELVQCSHCSRKFLPDRLAKHLKVEHGIDEPEEEVGYLEKLDTQLGDLTEEYQRALENMVECSICFRKFLPERLEKHMKICTGPRKPKDDRGKTMPHPKLMAQMVLALDEKYMGLPHVTTKPSRKTSADRLMRQTKPDNTNTNDNNNNTGNEGETVALLVTTPTPDLADYNAAVQSMVPCDKCGRKFLPDRLPKHNAVCSGSLNPPMSLEDRRKTMPSAKELARMAESNTHGKGFSESLLPTFQPIRPIQPIQPQGESGIPVFNPRNRTSLKLPTSDAGTSSGIPTPTLVTTNHSPKHNNTHTEMIACPMCGKMFSENSINDHFKECVEPPASGVAQSPLPSSKQEAMQLMATVDASAQDIPLAPCSKCSRTFHPDRLAKHMAHCTGNVERLQPAKRSLPRLGSAPQLVSDDEAVTPTRTDPDKRTATRLKSDNSEHSGGDSKFKSDVRAHTSPHPMRKGWDKDSGSSEAEGILYAVQRRDSLERKRDRMESLRKNRGATGSGVEPTTKPQHRRSTSRGSGEIDEWTLNMLQKLQSVEDSLRKKDNAAHATVHPEEPPRPTRTLSGTLPKAATQPPVLAPKRPSGEKLGRSQSTKDATRKHLKGATPTSGKAAKPQALFVDDPTKRGVVVHLRNLENESVIGEVILTASSTIQEMVDMIVEELSQAPGFTLKKNNIPITQKQYLHLAFEFFRTAQDHAVVVP